MSTLDWISEYKLVSIVRGIYGEELLALADALYIGGIKLIECTFDQSDTDCVEKTCRAIKMLSEKFDGKVCIGAGTVLNASQVEAACRSGARYIISPNVNEKVIARTKELGLVSVPGAMTPTEILNAHDMGADIVKLFPASSLGLRYAKDIVAPISHVKLMATGGINEENLGDFLRLGFIAAGIGGRLADRKLISEGRFEEISSRAANFANIVKQ